MDGFQDVSNLTRPTRFSLFSSKESLHPFSSSRLARTGEGTWPFLVSVLCKFVQPLFDLFRSGRGDVMLLRIHSEEREKKNPPSLAPKFCPSRYIPWPSSSTSFNSRTQRREQVSISPCKSHSETRLLLDGQVLDRQA